MQKHQAMPMESVGLGNWSTTKLKKGKRQRQPWGQGAKGTRGNLKEWNTSMCIDFLYVYTKHKNFV